MDSPYMLHPVSPGSDEPVVHVDRRVAMVGNQEHLVSNVRHVLHRGVGRIHNLEVLVPAILHANILDQSCSGRVIGGALAKRRVVPEQARHACVHRVALQASIHHRPLACLIPRDDSGQHKEGVPEEGVRVERVVHVHEHIAARLDLVKHTAACLEGESARPRAGHQRTLQSCRAQRRDDLPRDLRHPVHRRPTSLGGADVLGCPLVRLDPSEAQPRGGRDQLGQRHCLLWCLDAAPILANVDLHHHAELFQPLRFLLHQAPPHAHVLCAVDTHGDVCSMMHGQIEHALHLFGCNYLIGEVHVQHAAADHGFRLGHLGAAHATCERTLELDLGQFGALVALCMRPNTNTRKSGHMLIQ
mmetsp:Transcript_22435/g.72216  ORF Transcript_22435/g.72216 Transcript_22435/m.72216 type:complete len:358 (-) Transcript_22435:219-1292(-)